ncbi:Carbonic anhydrase alpha-class protein [Dioscorea alata]|uniref:Carbonic anhydrase alpha-class protein n=1 Tax=Dioscorea alata TaxID=55571 RepID=A0ACB7UQ01_DIOAL|nr:Carbonic anhydrase alpha-class protein [Dioscorea alata]
MSSSTLFHLFLLSSLLFSCLSNARLYADDFSYIEGSPNGPENWGNLRPEWKTCGNGKEQSPINLTSYQAARATVKNNGHDIMVYFKSDAGSQFINQVQYQLKRIHFHSPSEHALNGERYDLEVQMVHESQDQRRAVIAIMFRFGRSDPFLSDLEDFISQISRRENNEVDAGVVDPRQLLQFDDPAYYRYMGSYTAPPCTEDITWTVIKKLGTVSPRQVLMLKQAVNENSINNARPLQPLKFRTVFFYPHQKSDHDAM